MAISDIKIATVASASFTITLASLNTGNARQSNLITNTSPGYPAALVFIKMTSGGTAPTTAGTVYEVYLLRSDGTVTDDNGGISDAAITITNAPLLGTIVTTQNTRTAFVGIFDTSSLGPLGDKWGIAIKNSSGTTVGTVAGDFITEYTYYVPEAQ